MRYVAVTEGDKTEAEAIFGVQVNTWGVNDLVAAVDAAAAADVDALVEEYEDTYDVAPELQRGKERHQSLRDGAAIELGLRSFLDAGGFGAFTTNFEDLGGLKQLPGLAVQRLTDSAPKGTGRRRCWSGRPRSWAPACPAARR
jgi:L-arabinose isomerase